MTDAVQVKHEQIIALAERLEAKTLKDSAYDYPLALHTLAFTVAKSAATKQPCEIKAGGKDQP